MATTKEFIQQLGNQNDFVTYVRILEQTNKLEEELSKGFVKTSSGKRYLFVRNGPTKIIDFRHFFAAMLLSTRGYGGYARKTIGGTLLFGVANELKQCAEEMYARKINSCFSNEDLGSNRLGAEFGEIITIARSENSKESIASMLDRYLIKLDPLSSSEHSKLQLNSNSDILKQLVLAVMIGIKDSIISKAY